MSLLGLIGTEDLANYRYKSARRKVFYDYPNGAAPLTGILSLAPEEEASDPEFDWWEKRYKEQKTTTAANGANGPFAGASATVNNTGWGTTAKTTAPGFGSSTTATTVNDYVSVYVADTTQFRIGHIIKIEPLTMTLGQTTQRILLRVEGYNSTGTTASTTNPAGAGRLSCRIVSVWGNATTQGIVNNSNVTNVGIEVLVVGSAFSQGATGSSNAIYSLPINPQNYCQILRTKFAVTGSALKTGLKYDDTGVYKDQAKEASIDHMVELERALIWGERSKTTDDVTSQPRYTMGGILWFLLEWEKSGGGSFGYRPGGAALTADTDDQKRIINNTSGVMTEKLYDKYVERIFRTVNNKANEKLVLCGNGFLNVINQLYKSKSVLNGDLPLTDTYGMDVVKHRSPFGTLYYKTHPLFNQSSINRFSALFLDTGNLKYRPLIGRDTDLLTDRQANDEDARIDEWLTEAGLELQFPESHMWMENVLDYAA